MQTLRSKKKIQEKGEAMKEQNAITEAALELHCPVCVKLTKKIFALEQEVARREELKETWHALFWEISEIFKMPGSPGTHDVLAKAKELMEKHHE